MRPCNRRRRTLAGNSLSLTLMSACLGAAMAQSQVETPAPTRLLRAPDPSGLGATRTLNPLSSLDPGSLDAFKGRPLFAPSRRPAPVRQDTAAPALPVVESAAPDLRLVGVVSGLDTAVAILRRTPDGSPLNLKVGDTVDAWRVELIAPDRVTLREGEREKTYRLFTVGGANRTAAPRLAPSIPQLDIRPPQ